MFDYMIIRTIDKKFKDVLKKQCFKFTLKSVFRKILDCLMSFSELFRKVKHRQRMSWYFWGQD